MSKNSEKESPEKHKADTSVQMSATGESAVTLSLVGVDVGLLFGNNDVFLRQIESEFDARITARGESIAIAGEPEEVGRLRELFLDLISRVQNGEPSTEQYVRYAIDTINGGGEGPSRQMQQTSIYEAPNVLDDNGVKPRTIGQRKYMEAIGRSDVVIAIGPAGTGKTFLAVAAAVSHLKSGAVKRIVFVRPAVEAGESLGFLPGDIRDKIDPYLRPIYDALHDLLPSSRISKLMDSNIVEIAPLAFMRGRTLNNAFVVLDEAQNATTAQMKMFLTRLGENSKAIVTGDITQIDLNDKENSGLLSAERVLGKIKGLQFIQLSEKDVVRHRLVQQIILAYEREGEDAGSEQAE
jgi:phosphate starvation-inducible protein PhoH and related proteins